MTGSDLPKKIIRFRSYEVFREGGIQGPYTRQQVLFHLKSGKWSRDDTYRTLSQAEWQPMRVMWEEYQRKLRRDGRVSFLPGAIVFAALGFYLMFIGVRLVQEGNASLRWPSVPGKVTVSYVNQFRANDQSYEPRVTYTYEMEGHPKTHHMVSFGRETGSEAWAEAIVRRYPKGSSCRVYYSPINNVTLLEPGVPPLAKQVLGSSWLTLYFALLSALGATHCWRGLPSPPVSRFAGFMFAAKFGFFVIVGPLVALCLLKQLS